MDVAQHSDEKIRESEWQNSLAISDVLVVVVVVLSRLFLLFFISSFFISTLNALIFWRSFVWKWSKTQRREFFVFFLKAAFSVKREFFFLSKAQSEDPHSSKDAKSNH